MHVSAVSDIQENSHMLLHCVKMALVAVVLGVCIDMFDQHSLQQYQVSSMM